MKKSHWLAIGVVPVLLVCGCESMSHTDRGVLGGGVLGGAIGALAGGPRHAGTGALIGAGTGAVVGGLVGNSADKEEKARAAAIAATFAGPAQLQEIAGMAQNHISDAVIISQVRNSGLVYRLSGEDINYLKSYGVSDPVIMEMNATARRVYRERIVQPVYVVDPPPPPVSVGVGIEYRR